MYELMHLQFARQRHEKMTCETERERLVKEASRDREKRANRHRRDKEAWRPSFQDLEGREERRLERIL